jgi:hypothetical protein
MTISRKVARRLAAGMGVAYSLAAVLADRGAWLAYSWRTGAVQVWLMVGAGLTEAPVRGLQTAGLFATGDAFAILTYLPRALAADLLQQIVGTLAHIGGLGGNRFEGLAAICSALGPAGSLWLWLAVSLLVGAGLGLAALGLWSAVSGFRRARARRGGGRGK